jgi:hypothetical protein
MLIRGASIACLLVPVDAAGNAEKKETISTFDLAPFIDEVVASKPAQQNKQSTQIHQYQTHHTTTISILALRIEKPLPC